jgi:predicted N-acetyltransferase YhbS
LIIPHPVLELVSFRFLSYFIPIGKIFLTLFLPVEEYEKMILEMENNSSLIFKIASEPDEYEQIHQLNYATFVEEIPQHPANSEQLLVDKFHDENIYFICLTENRELAGMICLREKRPFSLDKKIENMDDYLPKKEPKCEIRLLSVKKTFRNSKVFYGLMKLLFTYCKAKGFEIAVMSGTSRQLKLYQHLGFKTFAYAVGTPEALYYPMYIEASDPLDAYKF